MPKYLIQGSYTLEGIQGVIRDGGSKRRAVVEQMIQKMGGRLEAFYFAFGEDDVVIIIDAPDNVNTAAAMLAVSASGSFSGKTVVLLTPEEIDQAVKRTVDYAAPGR